MSIFNNPAQLVLGLLLIFSSLGVILVQNPVHASLSFLLTLMTLSAIYLYLSAQLIAAMQILIYAGAILVIFMFVIILFQDAHAQIKQFRAKSSTIFLSFAGLALIMVFILMGMRLIELKSSHQVLPMEFGSIQELGRLLYIDFFVPFEAVTLLFLVAVIGALYMAKKER